MMLSRKIRRDVLVLASCLAAHSALAADSSSFVTSGDPSTLPLATLKATESLRTENPTARILINRGRVERAFGNRLAIGSTPEQSAWTFIGKNAPAFGAQQADLSPMGISGTPTRQLMFDRTTGAFKFTAVYYQQSRGGIPVHGAHATVLVRNEAQNPVVLTVNNLRELGSFQPTAATAISSARALSLIKRVGPTLRYLVAPPQLVIFADAGAPVLADRFIAESGDEADPFYARQLFIVDHATGAILHREDLVLHNEVSGTVKGYATPGSSPIRRQIPRCSPLCPTPGWKKSASPAPSPTCLVSLFSMWMTVSNPSCFIQRLLARLRSWLTSKAPIFRSRFPPTPPAKLTSSITRPLRSSRHRR